jgi:hypothetical protein
MEEDAGTKEVINGQEEKIIKEEIFTKIVRAGKRTYFFDVKATRKDDYYLTITESKKRLGKEGKVFYEKHKIFLYKEDFEKFTGGLKDAVTYIDNGRDDNGRDDIGKDDNDTDKLIITKPAATSEQKEENNNLSTGEFTNIEFEDLGKQ